MQARRKLSPGQKGTKKFLDQYGARLVCVCYRSDGEQGSGLPPVIMMKNIIRIAIGTGLILLIPAVLTLLAIWHWKPGAFVLAFVLLFGGAGLTYALVAKNMLSNKAYRFAVGVALAAVLLLVWMNVAVGGILGDDPANMMYFGVLFVGFIGAVIAHLEPQGMSRALFATAFAMVLVPAIALIIGTPALANGVEAVFGLHAVFAMLFVGSALLFRKAGRGAHNALSRNVVMGRVQ